MLTPAQLSCDCKFFPVLCDFKNIDDLLLAVGAVLSGKERGCLRGPNYPLSGLPIMQTFTPTWTSTFGGGGGLLANGLNLLGALGGRRRQ
jgi:hypothetical protein